MDEYSIELIFNNETTHNDTEEMDQFFGIYSKVTFYLAVVMIVATSLGICGNAMNVFIYTRPQMRRAPINVLLTGMSAVDLLLLMLGLVCFTLPSLNQTLDLKWVYVLSKYTTIYCYPILMALQTCSIWLLCVITIERYIAVCHPLRSLQWNTAYRMRLFMGLTMAVAFFYNVIRFWEYRFPVEGEVSSIVRPLLRNNSVYYAVYYTGLYIVSHFLLPFTVLIVFNAGVAKAIYAAKKARQRLSSMEQTEHSMGLMMLVVVSSFAICNLPVLLLNLTELVSTHVMLSHSIVYYLLNDTSIILIIFNSSTNVIIYYVFSEKFRLLCLYYFFCRGDGKTVANRATRMRPPGTPSSFFNTRNTQLLASSRRRSNNTPEPPPAACPITVRIDGTSDDAQEQLSSGKASISRSMSAAPTPTKKLMSPQTNGAASLSAYNMTRLCPNGDEDDALRRKISAGKRYGNRRLTTMSCGDPTRSPLLVDTARTESTMVDNDTTVARTSVDAE